MSVVLCIFAVIAILAIQWFVRGLLVTPLPSCVDCIFYLDGENDEALEYAFRGFRFLKKYDYLRGSFLIIPQNPSDEGLKCAKILAIQEDVSILEHGSI